jgi:hypothetical protein
MEFQPIEGQPVRFPPGKVAVTLGPDLWMAYKRLYARAGTSLSRLPRLRERDFDGRRTVKITQSELDSLNRGLARLQAPRKRDTGTVFEAQEQGRTRLFKRLQYLS